MKREPLKFEVVQGRWANVAWAGPIRYTVHFLQLGRGGATVSRRRQDGTFTDEQKLFVGATSGCFDACQTHLESL